MAKVDERSKEEAGRRQDGRLGHAADDDPRDQEAHVIYLTSFGCEVGSPSLTSVCSKLNGASAGRLF